MRTNSTRRRCAAPGCRAMVDRRWLMCATCWVLVPDGLRQTINAHYRPTGRQSIRYTAAVRQAIDAIASKRRQAA